MNKADARCCRRQWPVHKEEPPNAAGGLSRGRLVLGVWALGESAKARQHNPFVKNPQLAIVLLLRSPSNLAATREASHEATGA